MKPKILFLLGGISAFFVLSYILTDGFVEKYKSGFMTSLYFNLYVLRHTLLVFVSWALYALYSSKDRRLSSAALIINILGIVLFFLFTSSSIDFPDGIFVVAIILSNVLPALLFGILAYRYPQYGIARPLALMSILYGGVKIVFYILWNIFPDSDFGIVDSLPRTLEFLWLAWMGTTLIFGKLSESLDRMDGQVVN